MLVRLAMLDNPSEDAHCSQFLSSPREVSLQSTGTLEAGRNDITRDSAYPFDWKKIKWKPSLG